MPLPGLDLDEQALPRPTPAADPWDEIDQVVSARPPLRPKSRGDVWDEIDRTVPASSAPRTVGRDVLTSNAEHDLADQIPGAAERLKRAQAMSPNARVPFSMHSDPVDVAAAAMHADPGAFDQTMQEAAAASRHRGRRPDLGQRLVNLANSGPDPSPPTAQRPDVWDEIDKVVAAPARAPRPSPLDTVGPAAATRQESPRLAPGRVGYRGSPTAAQPAPPPTFMDRVRGALPAVTTAINATPEGRLLSQGVPAVAEAVGTALSTASGAFKAAPAAVGETVFGQNIPGHQGETKPHAPAPLPPSMSGLQPVVSAANALTDLYDRLTAHAQMVLSGRGGEVEPMGPIRAATNPPDTVALPTEEQAIHAAEMGQPAPKPRVRSHAEQVALETGRRGLDTVAQMAADPTAVAAMGAPGVAGDLLAGAFSVNGIQTAARVAANPKATDEDVAEAVLGVAIQTLPLVARPAVVSALNATDAAVASGGKVMRSAILAAKLRTPNVARGFEETAHAGVHAPLEAMEHVGGQGAPAAVGETLGEAVRTAAAPEPEPGSIQYNEQRERPTEPEVSQTPREDLWQGVDAALQHPEPATAARPTSHQTQDQQAIPSPSVVQQTEARRGAVSTAAPAPEFVPVGEEPTADRIATSPSESEPSPDVVARVREKLARGEPLGTEEARQAFAERQRVEDIRARGAAEPEQPGAVIEERQSAPSPDVWTAVDDAIAERPLNTGELRELRRMHAELLNMPYTPRTRTEWSGGPKGKQEEWTAGAGGAPVHHDIGGKNRTASIDAIQRILDGKTPNAAGRRAIAVARARIADNGRVSKPVLPLSAGESGVPMEAGPEDIRARANARVADPSDLEFLARRYDERSGPGRDFGNVVSRDNAKELFYRDGSPQERTTLNDAVSDAAGAVAERVYARRLAEPVGPEKLVIGTSGGTGSGKTTVAMNSEHGHAADVIFDSQGTDPHTMERRMRQAQTSGRRFMHVFVYRDPVDAWIQGVLPRGEETGRPVSIEGHVASHEDAIGSALIVAARHTTDPQYTLHVVDNTAERAYPVPTHYALRFLKEKAGEYNADDVREVLQDATERANDQGLIRPELYRAYVGESEPPPGASGVVREGAERRSPEGREGSEATPVQEAPRRGETGSRRAPEEAIGSATPLSALPHHVGEPPITPGPREMLSGGLDRERRTPVQAVSEFRDDVLETFAPAEGSRAAILQAGSIRSKQAAFEQRVKRVVRAVKAREDAWERRPEADRLALIDAIETGALETLSPDDRRDAEELRRILDADREQLIAADLLHTWMANYFPHVWQRPSVARSVLARLLARRPMWGSEAYRKKRTFPTTAEGMAAGLVPVSTNPYTLMLLKHVEAQKSLMGRGVLKDGPALGVAVPIMAGHEDTVPTGWVPYPDGFGTIWGPPTIPIKEAYDPVQMKALEDFATSLGVTVERKVAIGGRGRWGYSVGDEIGLKFGGPAGVLMHEIGHQLDDKYGLGEKIGLSLEGEKREEENFNEKERRAHKELARLADMRLEGGGGHSGHFRSYIRSREEKIANLVHAFIYAPERARELAPYAYFALHNLAKDTPALRPLIELQTAKSTAIAENIAEVYAGGRVIKGRYYGPPEAVKLIERYLSPGWRGHVAFDAWMGLNGKVTKLQLGISAFHAVLTGGEAFVQKLTVAMMEASRGEWRPAARHLAEVPIAPIVDLVRGHGYMRDLYDQDAILEHTATVADRVVAGGGGFGHLLGERTHGRRFLDALHATGEAVRAGKIVRIPTGVASAAWNGAWAAFEEPTRLMMQYWVPYLKIAAYLDRVGMELRDLGPTPKREEVWRVLGKQWDAVDDLDGQLRYQNLFWKNTTKHAAQATFRAVGFNLGSIRHILGAPHQQLEHLGWLPSATGGGGKRPTRIRHVANADGPDGQRTPIYEEGPEPWLSERFAHLLSLMIATYTAGAIYQWYRSGLLPGQKKDGSFDASLALRDGPFPRTGGRLPDGSDERMTLPSYFRFIYEMGTSPARAVTNRFVPLLNIAAELWQNEDYYRTEIRNPDDPLVDQMRELSDYLVKKPEPFSVMRYQRGGSFDSLLGVTPAPSSATRSKADQLMDRYLPRTTHTARQAEAAAAEAQVREGMRAGNAEGQAAVDSALATGVLSKRQFTNAVSSARVNRFQARFQRLSLSQALRVYEESSPVERGWVVDMMARKADRVDDAAPRDQAALLERIRRAQSLPLTRQPNEPPITRRAARGR